MLTISDMIPGRFNFRVESQSFARWWSDEAASEWNRRTIPAAGILWQRNFDFVDFDVTPAMKPVTIVLERSARVTGRVVDPDGKPVAGATVDPALSGTGRSLSGDTRFSVRTGANGRFELVLPASGLCEYSLFAHDGKYHEWRTWANGVGPTIQTVPGQVVADAEIRLTRPAAVRGKVIDGDGRPIADRKVRARGADGLGNITYSPTAMTSTDGSYALKFIRPGEAFIQVAPFAPGTQQPPAETSQVLDLAPGQVKLGVDFRLASHGEQR